MNERQQFHFDWILFVTGVATIITILVILAGCVTVQSPAILPFPQAPSLTFTAVPGGILLGMEDANKLRKWMDELNAYQHALKRLEDAHAH